MLNLKNKSVFNYIRNKRNNYFFNLIISYIVIISLALSIVTSTSYKSFYSTYTTEFDQLNQNILQYLITIINDNIIVPIDNIYADVVFNQEEKYLKSFIESTPNQLEISTIYDILTKYVVNSNRIVAAVHLYSFKTGIIISSQYGYKTQHNSSINRDFVNLANPENKDPYWIPTRNANAPASASSSRNILTKVFYIGSPKEQALLAIDIDERLLYNYVENLINKNTNEIIIVDKNMDIITHQDKSLLGTKLLPEYQKTLQNKSNSTTDLDYEGQKLVLSHANIKNADWQIILISDIKSFYPAIGKITTTLLFALGLAVIIAFLLAFFYSKKLSKPIKRLTYMFKKNNSEPLDDIVSNIFNQVSELNIFVEENRDILQNHFIICSYYNSFASDEDLEMRSSVLLRNFHGKYYTSCVIELNRGDKGDLLLYFQIANILKEQISPLKLISNEIGSDRIALICAFDNKDDFVRIPSRLFSLLKTIESNITIYIGEITEKLVNLPDGFIKIQKMFEYKFFYSEEKYIFYDRIKNKIENDEREDVHLPPFKISVAIAEGYQTYVENFISNLVFGPYSVSQANHAILEALHAIAAEAKDKRIPLSSCQEYIKNHNLSNIYQVQEIMLKICCTYVENLHAMTENKNYVLIENIKAFIGENLQNNISLTTIAEHTHLTTTYLSKFFKAETGINLSDYIKDVKLIKAKDYLLNTNLTVNEISEKLSYNTPHYFIKLFKEKYELTPKNFRQTYSN